MNKIAGFLILSALLLSGMSWAVAQEDGTVVINDTDMPLNVTAVDRGGRQVGSFDFGGKLGQRFVFQPHTAHIYASAYILRYVEERYPGVYDTRMRDQAQRCNGMAGPGAVLAVKVFHRSGNFGCVVDVLTERKEEATLYNSANLPATIKIYNRYHNLLREATLPAGNTMSIPLSTAKLAGYFEKTFCSDGRCRKEDCGTEINVDPNVSAWVLALPRLVLEPKCYFRPGRH